MGNSPADSEKAMIASIAFQMYGQRRGVKDPILPPEPLVVQDSYFIELLGALKEQLVYPPRNGKTLPPSDMVTIEPGGTSGLDARSALSRIGGRYATVSRWPHGRQQPTVARTRSLYGPALPNYGDVVPVVKHGHEIDWRMGETPFPNFQIEAPLDQLWWPRDYSSKQSWYETALVAVAEDARGAGLKHLGLMAITWYVCALETDCGRGDQSLSWAKKGLNLGATVALPIDGDAYFTSVDSSPQAGKYIARFTAFNRIYPNPATAWAAAAGRVRSTLQRARVTEAFSTTSSFPTDSEIGFVARLMYEHGYYTGTHKLMEGGQVVLRGGHPVPDAEANIKAYGDRLREIAKANARLLHTMFTG